MKQVLIALEHCIPTLNRDVGVWPAVRMSPDQTHHSHYDGVEVQRHEVRGTHTSEIQELTEKATQPVALTYDQSGQKPLVFVCMLGAGKLLHRAPDRREGVTDLVGQRSAELCHRLEPLRPHVELLHLL